MRCFMKIYNARWSQFFAHSDLIAGWEYACRGKIIDIKQSSKAIKATVKGSKSYKVTFEIRNATVICDMNCTCPSFKTKRYCKHCAAVLWNLDPLSKKERAQSNLL